MDCFYNHDSAAKWNYLYASQTENGCEKRAVTIELINTLPASNYDYFVTI
jgi:hypothetical protein